ncbi:hypothetical protein ACFYO5_02850 [Streptomyces sp. NPDC006259]|uniref:hypothetical protein n=1 Tax=Streptomyces sp. NPDC006259 TaxID=3364740 RepID=UPI00369B80FA
MRGVGAAVAASVAVVLLTGCGNGGGGAEAEQTAGGRTAAVAGPRELTTAMVEAEISAAAAAADWQPRFLTVQQLGGHPCRTMGSVRTHGSPDRKDAEVVVGELKERGWSVRGEDAGDGGHAWFLEKLNWTVNFGISTATAASPEPEARERTPTGAVFDGSGMPCAAMSSAPASTVPPPEPPALP